MIAARVMGARVQSFLLTICFQVFVIGAQTNSNDYAALSQLISNWQNIPPSWTGVDPCGKGWEGIQCANSRITSIGVSGMSISGSLSGDIGSLTELQTLDLSQNKGLSGPLTSAIGKLKMLENLNLIGCSFSGPIPDTIGSLTQLVTLNLASNNFVGSIPPSIGYLSKLSVLDLTKNQLTGTIPVSDGNSPGLDMLLNTLHFHLGQNNFSGPIPAKLFSSQMQLIHVLFDGNQLNGTIPTTLGLVTSLEVIRLDRNSISGHIPSNFTSLVKVSELYLSNNKLSGPIPDLSSLNLLTYLDMSNNSFDVSQFPEWFPNLTSLTSLIMEATRLQGSIPSAFFSLSALQSVVLSNNQLSGTLNIGQNFGSKLQLIDLQNNNISFFVQGTGYSNELLLEDNPFCQNSGSSQVYCTAPQQQNNSYSTPDNGCAPPTCSSNQISSPNCHCADPIIGALHFRAISFSDIQDPSYYTSLQNAMMASFQSNHLPVDSISLSHPFMDVNSYLNLELQVFPSGSDHFNRTGFSIITSQLNNLTFFQLPNAFGPFYFTLYNSGYFVASGKSSNTGIVIGAAVGGSVLVLLLLIIALYAFHQRKRLERAATERDPFASWDQGNGGGSRPEIKGVKKFSFEDLRKCSNSFSDANIIGSGGYGKVYRGTLLSGQLVAIKRAEQGSLQGGTEFKNEIELLSRVHHKNLVRLLGFCFEQGEQMLVYEFVPNGNLQDCLLGRTGIKLDWKRRLKVALGAARGLAYLHDFADPPIIHRDIKSNNILLDEFLNAKVSDFGLSKPLGDAEKLHVTTQVKGTMGYLDPEYYMTQQLTEKSDVYSFGVVILELITGRRPIQQGKYIVREVRQALDKTKDLYNLQELLDAGIGLDTTLKGLNKFVDLAMKCVQESGTHRPTMGEVVKEIESILQLAGVDPNTESASTSASYGDAGKGISLYPYSNEGFDYSGIFLSSKIEPK